MTINRDRIIGNLSNYDMDFDEDDINGSEGEDDYDDEPDYEDLVQRKKEDEEWEAEHYDWGNWHYPDNRGW
jgi:hypothetical protein